MSYNLRKLNEFRSKWQIDPQVALIVGLILALALSIFQVGYYLFFQDDPRLVATADILTVVSDLAAVASMVLAAGWSRKIDRRLEMVWNLFTLAMVFWTLGDVLWAYYEIILNNVPSPFVGDIFYLLCYPFFFIGILKIPRQHENSARAAWLWLDFFIVLFSAFGIYWNFIIGPALLDTQQPWLSILVNTTYPAFDLLLIMAITFTIFFPLAPTWRTPMILLFAGHVLTAVADSIFNYQVINDNYAAAAFFNILFSIGPLVLMLSGLYQALIVKQVMQKPDAISEQPRPGQVTFLRLVVPLCFLLFAYILLILGGTAKQAFQSSQYSLWVVFIIILISIRQVLGTLDNNRLSTELRVINNDLEKRVADRTSDLMLSNTELHKEIEERNRIEKIMQEREEKFAHFALHDPLTELPNRSLLFDRILQAIQHHNRSKERFAVLFLDLDGFKVVNDSLGHIAGDQLLIQITKRLKMLIRAEDTVARLGGDEFVILLEGFQKDTFVATVAERVLRSINEPFVLNTQPVFVTASVGLVIAGDNYQTPVEIIRDADLAMYKAKATGKNRYEVFTPNLHDFAIDRLVFDADMRVALNLNQFVLHYQPILELETGRLSGFEALIRWQHPTRGLIGPSEFIPIAESIGLIDAITRWSLQQACHQLQDWQNRFPLKQRLSMSVNISPFTLNQPELSQWVYEILHTNPQNPPDLILEIVETSLVQETEFARQVFTNLRNLGARICLDDFGIGYSSLGYINEFPIDILKIDRSFISHVVETPKVASIARSIATLARELNIDVVAEGIETEAQAEIMKQIGCQYGQGFLFSKGLAPQDAEARYLCNPQ